MRSNQDPISIKSSVKNTYFSAQHSQPLMGPSQLYYQFQSVNFTSRLFISSYCWDRGRVEEAFCSLVSTAISSLVDFLRLSCFILNVDTAF